MGDFSKDMNESISEITPKILLIFYSAQKAETNLCSEHILIHIIIIHDNCFRIYQLFELIEEWTRRKMAEWRNGLKMNG